MNFSKKTSILFVLRGKLWLILFTLLSLHLFGQPIPYSFHQLTSQKNKLSSSKDNLYILKNSHNYLWISSDVGLNCYNGKTIKQYLPQRGDSTSVKHSVIQSSFYEDENHDIWFSTVDALHRYNRKQDNFQQIPVSYEDQILEGFYFLLNIDKESDDLWFGIKNALYRLPNRQVAEALFVGTYPMNFLSILEQDKQNFFLLTPQRDGLFIQTWNPNYEAIESDTLLRQSNIRAVHFIDKQHIWVGTNKGLIELNLMDKTHRHYDGIINDVSIERINDIASLDATRLIIGTQNQGIFLFNTKKGRFEGEIYEFDGLKINPFPHPIERIYIDKDQTLWVSTTGRGVFFTSLNSIKFQNYLQNIEGKAGENAFIRSLAEDKHGNIWCLSQKGITLFNKQEKKLETATIFIDNKAPFARGHPYFIYADAENTIWTSDHYGGLYYKPPNEPVFKKANIKGVNPNAPLGITIIHAFNNEIYASSTKGVFRWNRNTTLLEKVTSITPTDEAFTWIAENPQSKQILFRRHQNSFLIGHFQQDSFKLDTAINFKPFINFLHPDTIDNKFWIATSEGLYYLAYKGENYELIQDTVLSYRPLLGVLKEDNSDNLWLSGNQGIIRYNIKTGKERVYGLVDGIQSLEYNFWSAYKTKTGELMFGGINGFNYFDPKTIKDNAPKASPTISSISINYKPPKEKLVCEKTKNQNINFIKSLRFPYDQNTLSFEFAALDYIDPDANKFRYRLKGYIDEWSLPSNNNFASFPNLPPDSYVFEVNANNADGIWSDKPAQLAITIDPPLWRTWWAYFLYFLLGIGLLYWAYKFQLNARLAKAEAYRIKELEKVKSDLYANITHEFRTPLTIILGMAEQIKSKTQGKFETNLEMIRESGQNLLTLVNKVLDLAKIESKNMQANYIQGDIICYIAYIVQSFDSYVASKNIQLTFRSELKELLMDYDSDKLQTILTNLIINAYKFSPQDGKIIIQVKQIENTKKESTTAKACQIKVIDNGIGIKEEHLPYIFDRFYQIDRNQSQVKGTGLGLALTKELIELMGGTITASSNYKKGSEFTFLLPISQTAPIIERPAPVMSIPSPLTAPLINKQEVGKKGNLPLILIIEDSLGVATYLQQLLQDKYKTAIASNGKIGIEMALELIPDLIITDVMMPEKDGYELCETLKNDERSSHIPIIMITAKANMEDKISGLSKGADAYLFKPFNQAELEVRIKQLLEQRNRFQTYYRQLFFPEIFSLIEDKFIKKAIELIKEDTSGEYNNNAEQFSKDLGLGRIQINRKIKAVTGYTTTEFINQVRLNKACHLLLTTELDVKQIAYAIGYNSPQYFSRRFKKIFNESPMDFRKRNSI